MKILDKMTPRERFIAALERKFLKGRVPHFELVFFLTMDHGGFWQGASFSSQLPSMGADE